MGFSKLREWVGTVTGKGDRWGRDSVGRSAPAFMAASTTALPPLTCTAIGRLQHRRQLLFCCEAGQLWPLVLRPVPDGASAGCVRLQYLFCGLCACHLCLPCPLPFSTVCPRSVCFTLLAPIQFTMLLFACHLFIPCAPGSSVRAGGLFQSGPAVCKLQDCPVGSCNTGLQWRPVRRSIL